ncbi:Dehydrogenase/reductase SDR family member 11 [Cryptotermes secundus]|uniref:Dehydrogenase/reductase SDR family member 11 n=1 Tax=Cryptotermes secundus TaxID=105785 RepID=A0A2J7PJU4_9NEOP|nr:Dehydrogenase/reductase SDR family member 11 [Cryptotermes secundus]
MQRWAGRVAMVTGASSGIGAAITKELVKNGLKVIGMARRVENIEALSASLQSAAGQLYPVKADLTRENEVCSVFRWVKSNLGGVDVLVNSAGVASANSLIDGPVEKWKHILELNILGQSLCTKEAIQSMNERGVNDGHIVNINSMQKHACAHIRISKYGIRFTQDVAERNPCSLSPGTVRTDLPEASGLTDPYQDNPYLEPQDVADAVVYVLGTRPHVQVSELIIRPMGETRI